ncbi:MAG TPA: hypothetical protein ENN11_02440, partial [Methanomicrobia archaeon]|nr:hypothetical protein [Methanomicrobia archaeon]
MRQARSIVLLLVCVLVSIPLICGTHAALVLQPASDVFVSTAYMPSTPGWDVTHFASLERAVDAVSDNGTVRISGGEVIVATPIVVDKEIRIVGTGSDDTVVVFDGDDAPLFLVTGDGVLSLCDISLEGGGYGIVSCSGEVSVQRCEVRGARHAGIVSYSLRSPATLHVRSSLIHHGNAGIVSLGACGGASLCVVEGATISDNGDGVISASWGPRSHTGVSIDSSILSFHARRALHAPGVNVTITHCGWWENGDEAPSQGMTIRDPLYADGYRLSASSPLIDAGNPLRSGEHSITGTLRPSGDAPDMGAYEGGRHVLLHLTDLHLLAPVGDTAYTGVNLEPRLWDVETFISSVASSVPGDLEVGTVVITGDIVDLATTEPTYQTPLGSVTREQWDDTYRGYELFRDRLETAFPGVPIYDVVGNHDYREHPFYPWLWGDESGIDDAFRSAMNYAPLTVVELSGTDGLYLVLLSSGHDAPRPDGLHETVIYPYLAEHAANGDDIISYLTGQAVPEGVEGFLGGLAYG